MCLGIPGKVTKIYEQDGIPMASSILEAWSRRFALPPHQKLRSDSTFWCMPVSLLNVLSDTEAEETLKILHDLQEFNARLTEEDQIQ